MLSEVKNNIFDGNQNMGVLTSMQSYTQASDLYILGGENTIHHNIFENARGLKGEMMKEFAPNFYYYMPENYYSYA